MPAHLWDIISPGEATDRPEFHKKWLICRSLLAQVSARGWIYYSPKLSWFLTQPPCTATRSEIESLGTWSPGYEESSNRPKGTPRHGIWHAIGFVILYQLPAELLPQSSPLQRKVLGSPGNPLLAQVGVVLIPFGGLEISVLLNRHCVKYGLLSSSWGGQMQWKVAKGIFHEWENEIKKKWKCTMLSSAANGTALFIMPVCNGNINSDMRKCKLNCWFRLSYFRNSNFTDFFFFHSM